MQESMTKIDTTRLRRRAPGKKTLIYLDQSTLSFLATPEGGQLLRLLRQGVQSDTLVCPSSPDHADESLLAARSQVALHDLADELAMGIEFFWDFQIEHSEILAAACAFLGAPMKKPIWREAFNMDPHTARARLYPGGVRIGLAAQRADWQVREVQYEKGGVEDTTEIYERIRSAGRSFESQVDLELNVLIRWKLGPLVEPERYRERVARLAGAAAREAATPDRMVAPGSAFNLYSSARNEAEFPSHLIACYPELQGRMSEFVRSDALLSCPSLRYPALITAAIATTPGRKAKAGDRYDRSHLTKGLSRCDIVTCDSGMAQLCRGRRLIPADVTLFSSSEHNALASHIERIIAQQRLSNLRAFI